MATIIPSTYAIGGDIKEKQKTKTTLQGFYKIAALKEMEKCILEGLLDKACFWATELDISGHSKMLWKRLLKIACTDINCANPNLPNLLWASCFLFQDLTKYKEALYNNQSWRNHVCQMVVTLCLSSKQKLPKFPHWKKDDPMKLEDIQGRIHQKDIRGLDDILKLNDHRIIYIPINEIHAAIMHNKDVQKTRTHVFFWLSYILEIERRNKSYSLCISRHIPHISPKCHREIVWVIWQMVFKFLQNQKSKHPHHEKLTRSVEHLYKCFRLEYCPGARRQKLPFLMYALTIIMDTVPPIDFNKPVQVRYDIELAVVSHVNLLYKQTYEAAKKHRLALTSGDEAHTDQACIPKNILFLPRLDKKVSVYDMH